MKMLCTECGFPFPDDQTKCKCKACNELANKRGTTTKIQIGHDTECWRKGARRHGLNFPPEVKTSLDHGWGMKGCQLQLKHDPTTGYFFE